MSLLPSPERSRPNISDRNPLPPRRNRDYGCRNSLDSPITKEVTPQSTNTAIQGPRTQPYVHESAPGWSPSSQNRVSIRVETLLEANPVPLLSCLVGFVHTLPQTIFAVLLSRAATSSCVGCRITVVNTKIGHRSHRNPNLVYHRHSSSFPTSLVINMDPTNPLYLIWFSDLDPYKNCAVAGEFTVRWERFLIDDDSFPIRTFRSFVIACSNTTIGNFTDGNLVDWYRQRSEFDNLDLYDTVGLWDPSQCSREYCEHLGFVGNADLAGIGVSSCPSPGLLSSISHANV